MSTSLPRSLAVAAATAIVSMVVVLGAEPAAAHTGLQSSVPADGEALTVAPDAVTLTFGTAVASEFTQVAVTGPDGQSVNAGEPMVEGAAVSQPVSAGGDGAYVVAYRVVSEDGHPVSGQLGFTLTGIGAGAATAPAAAEPTGASTPAPRPDAATTLSPAAISDGGSSWGPWPMLAVVALVLAVGTWLVMRRRSRSG